MTYRYEDLAEKHFQINIRSGAEFMVKCCFHDSDSFTMQFNVDRGLYVCFACGASGNIRSLERHLGIRAAENPIDVTDIRARLDALVNPKAEVLPVLDEKHLRRYEFPTDYWGACTNEKGCSGGRGCRMHRNLAPKTIASFDLGYDPVHNIGTIPIRDINGGLLGFIKRYLDEDAPLRYRYPKGFKRSQNLFASWLVEQHEDDTVVLTEGSIDAMCVWEAGYAAMAIYGSSLSPSQMRILRRQGVGRIILFFDDDRAGRKATASALGKKRRIVKGKEVTEYDPRTDLSREFLVETVRYRRSWPADPGSMENDAILFALRKTKKVL